MWCYMNVMRPIVLYYCFSKVKHGRRCDRVDLIAFELAKGVHEVHNLLVIQLPLSWRREYN